MTKIEFGSVKHLWLDFIEGDEDAYASLYRIYAKKMYLYGLHFSDDPQIVEDAIHDIFVKLHSNRSRLPKQVDNVQLYLLISLKNRLLNLCGKYHEIFRIDISDYPTSIDAESRIIATEISLQRQQIIDQLEKILSPRQQQAIYYRFMEQMPYKEVATIMGINVQSVKNTVQTAIEKIRKEMPPHLRLLCFAWGIIKIL